MSAKNDYLAMANVTNYEENLIQSRPRSRNHHNMTVTRAKTIAENRSKMDNKGVPDKLGAVGKTVEIIDVTNFGDKSRL